MSMNNNPAKFDSTLRRNLHRKNIDLRPLGFPSLLGITMGVLMLMAVAAPSAHAIFLETYYDFEDGNLSSDAPGLQPTTISFTASSYPGGNLGVAGTVATPVGTSLNSVTPSTIMALDARGNSTQPLDQYCFMLGGLTTTGLTDITLSFAILSQGNGGQFPTLNLLYSTTGVAGTYKLFDRDTSLQS
jgi:hypothetical protein